MRRGDFRQSKVFTSGARKQAEPKGTELMMFMQLAEGVDEETWIYHLRRTDYSKWIREKTRMRSAAAIEAIESDQNISAPESRRRITEAIQQLYTLAA